jgi:hypothetical protein
MTLGTSYLIGRTLAENMTEPGQADWGRPDAAETCRVYLFWSGSNATAGARSSRRSAARLANFCPGDGCRRSLITHIAVGSSKESVSAGGDEMTTINARLAYSLSLQEQLDPDRRSASGSWPSHGCVTMGIDWMTAGGTR